MSPAETDGTPVAIVKRSYPNKYPEAGIPMLSVNISAKNTMRIYDKDIQGHGYEQYTVDPCRKVNV